MTVVDFGAVRFADISARRAEHVVDEAEELIDLGDGKAASYRVVEAWIILNAAAVTAKRSETPGAITKMVEDLRKRVIAMGGALEALGYTISDVPEARMALFVRRAT